MRARPLAFVAWPVELGGEAAVAAIVVGVAVLVVVALLFAVLLLSRRQQRQTLAELTLALEELRSGKLRTRPDVDARSPFRPLADAVVRLGHDLGSRLADPGRAGPKLDALLDLARNHVLLTTDADGDIRAASGHTEAVLGWKDHELLGRPVAALFEEDSWKELLPRLARRTLREKGVDAETVLLRRSGEKFPARIAVRLLHGPDGDVAGFLLGVADIGRLVRLEREVEDAERRYRELLDGLPSGAAILRGGRLVYANEPFGRLLGLAAGEVEGKPLRDRVGTGDLLVLEDRLAALERAVPGETETLRLALVQPPAGVEADIELRLSAIRSRGEPAVLAIVADTGEVRRLEAELRLNQARLDSALEAMTDGVVVLTETISGEFVRMTNASFLDTFALARDRVLGASREDLARMLEERGEGAEAVARLLSAPAGPLREPVVVGTGEHAAHLECVVGPLRHPAGGRAGRVLICRDLSEQKALERSLEAHAETLRHSREALERTVRQLEEAHAELAERSGQLERLNRELRTLDRMKSDLLANVSHELQTPLVAVRGYTEMVAKGRLGPVTEEQRRALELSLRNVDRMIAMIDELFDLVRGRPETLRLETFPLEPLVDEAVATLDELVRQKRILVTRRVEEPGLVVQGDRNKLHQVFLNLLSNAVKYNREGGEVEISVRRGRPGFVLVQVRDTGVGIPEQELDRIFERGYRASAPAAEGREGAGLGLFIVKQLLRLHGCTIQASSRLGEGSVFSFTLPLALEEEEEGRADRPRDCLPAAENAGRRDEDGREPPPAERPVEEGRGQPAARPRLRIIRR